MNRKTLLVLILSNTRAKQRHSGKTKHQCKEIFALVIQFTNAYKSRRPIRAMVDVVTLHSYLFFMNGARYIPTMKLGILEKAHCRLCNMSDKVSLVHQIFVLHPK